MTTPSPLLETFDLRFMWPTFDPFLTCVHHVDAFPRGTKTLGPALGDLKGHTAGNDVNLDSEWRMYYGTTVPGFPRHPHRGFETITYLRRGTIDHADSLGACARLGAGDVQWITTGRGVQHSEMFPLLNQDGPNPTELFQIWLNLPAIDKMAEPGFRVHWQEQIPRYTSTDAAGRQTSVLVIAGQIEPSVNPLVPPPASWASRSEANVAIWHVEMAPNASWQLPPAGSETARALYVFQAGDLTIGDASLERGRGARIQADEPLQLAASDKGAHALILQGRPIAEPVAKHGPFVMNTSDEIRKAYADCTNDGFGGWPWKKQDPNHGPSSTRFAIHPNGIRETPPEGNSAS